VIAQSWYKVRHDGVARIIHWELARKGNFEVVSTGGNIVQCLYCIIVASSCYGISPFKQTGIWYTIALILPTLTFCRNNIIW